MISRYLVAWWANSYANRSTCRPPTIREDSPIEDLAAWLQWRDPNVAVVDAWRQMSELFEKAEDDRETEDSSVEAGLYAALDDLDGTYRETRKERALRLLRAAIATVESEW